MNWVSREGCVASGRPASRHRMSQASGWIWRKQVATILLFVYGFLLLPDHAMAGPPPLPSRPLVQVASLRVTPQPSDLPLPSLSPRVALQF